MVRGGVLAAIAGLVALPACSFLLDFDDPIGDAAPLTSDAMNTCDEAEPNDSQAMAAVAVSGTTEASLCPATDLDYYGFTIAAGVDLIASLTFDGERHDLTLTLLTSDGSPMTRSEGSTSEERIEHSAALLNNLPAGDYALLVSDEGTTGDVVPYTLELSGI